MTDSELLALLQRVGALISDSHIVYTSGRHGSSYVNKDALYPYTTETSQVCAQLAAAFAATPVEVVAGPSVGGVIMAQWVAAHLQRLRGHEVLAVYAEEEISGRRTFRRGYDALVAGRQVLVVEDILTTGGSARKVVQAVQAAGGSVVGLGALCNRGNLAAPDLGVPTMTALVNLPLESWDASACPLCQAGIPINTEVGKGAAFVAQQHTSTSGDG
jgi:orotate phosphoribosyltransferase